MEIGLFRAPTSQGSSRGLAPTANSGTIQSFVHRVCASRDGAGACGLLRGQGFALVVAPLPARVRSIRRSTGDIVVPSHASPDEADMAALTELARHLLVPYTYTESDVVALAEGLFQKIDRRFGKVIDLFR